MNDRSLYTVALALVAAVMTSACAQVSVPIEESFSVVLPEFDTEELDAYPEGWEFMESTPVYDTEELLGDLPEEIQYVTDIRLLEITLNSPKIGNLGEWLSDITLYISTDDQLSDDDHQVVYLPDLPPDQAQFVVPITDGTTLQRFIDTGSIAIITTGTLIDVPTEEMTIPIELSAEAVIAVF